MSKIVLIILVLIAIPIGVYLTTTQGTTQYRIRAGEKEAALVFLMPSEVRTKVGEKTEVLLKIDTGKETVGGVKILISFGPDYLDFIPEARPGAAFTNLKTSQDKEGQLIIEGEGSLIGQGTIATLSFEALNVSQTEINIDKTSIVWNEGKTGNIFRNSAGAKIIIE